ncbi:MAG TPA: HEAT repeat domain-containing protein [Kofleriaceae bacterium]|nr:HEAT repeat domain-containing protein [Kofleriaceae bacterium]
MFPIILLFVLQSQAKADQIDDLVTQMTTSGDYKVRLSAALNLAKTGSKRPKVVRAFVKALGDSDKTVRGVSATTLGKLVDASTEATLRDEVLRGLKNARDNDSNSFVRTQAEKAYDALKSLQGGGEAPVGGIYIDVSGMGVGPKVSGFPTGGSLMSKAALGSFRKEAAQMLTSWPSGGAPTKAALDSKKMHGFHVSGTLVDLSQSASGSQVTVACKVSMILASFPEKSMFGFLEGGASVTASNNAQEIQYAKEDCISAVVENLVAKKIIPTIKIKASAP